MLRYVFIFFFSSRRRHTRFDCDWSSDVCSSDLFRVSNASLRGNVGKCSVPIIVIEDVRDALEIVGVAVGPQAGFLFSTIAVVPEAPIHITGQEEVEVAVIVVIEEPGARTPSASDNSGALRYVGERAVPIVMVESVPSIA